MLEANNTNLLTLCMHRSDNAHNYTYVVDVRKGLSPLLKTLFKSATTGVHLQFALITQAIHGWSEALVMHFLLKERCTTQNKDVSGGATCENMWCLPQISAQINSFHIEIQRGCFAISLVRSSSCGYFCAVRLIL